jgi:predicted esterase
MKHLWLILCLPLFAQDDPPPDPALTQIRAFVQGTAAEREAARAELAKRDPLKKKELEKWREAVWAEVNRLPKADGKRFDHPVHPMSYRVLGEPKEGGSLLVFLHGGGNSKKVNDMGFSNAVRRWAPAMGFDCALVPRCNNDRSVVGWAERTGRLAIQGLIMQFVRTHKLDWNRVYLGGFSMGGWAMPRLGPAMPDRLAAIFMASGGIPANSGGYGNLHGLPVSITVGEKDTAYGRLRTSRQFGRIIQDMAKKEPDGFELRYREIKGGGHVMLEPVYKEIGEWLRTKKRTPLPKIVQFFSLYPDMRMQAWLGRAGATGKGQAVRAEIDGNTITLTGDIKGLVIYLNDEMVNLKKKVTVKFGDKEIFEGRVRPSLLALVESIAEKQDPSRVFTARLVVPEPGEDEDEDKDEGRAPSEY